MVVAFLCLCFSSFSCLKTIPAEVVYSDPPDSSVHIDHTWPSVEMDDPQDGIQYLLAGHMGYGGFTVAQSVLHTGVRQKLVSGDVDSTCSGSCNTILVEPGTPSEMAFWIALAQYFSTSDQETIQTVTEKGYGTFQHDIRSVVKDADEDSQTAMSTISIEAFQFQIRPGVQCSAALKIYAEDIVDRSNPAAAAREWLFLQGYSSEEDMGTDIGAKSESQFHFSLVYDGQQYRMSLELEEELEYADVSRFSHSKLECKSTETLFASELPYRLGFNPSVKLGTKNYWSFWVNGPA
jgi:hypothetical protein